VKAAKVLQTRELRDRRHLVEVDCACCDSTHWLLNPSGAVVECLSTPGKFMWVDNA
jgi:hypothetical protein